MPMFEGERRVFQRNFNSLNCRGRTTVTWSRCSHGNLVARKPVDNSPKAPVIHGNLIHPSTVT